MLCKNSAFVFVTGCGLLFSVVAFGLAPIVLVVVLLLGGIATVCVATSLLLMLDLFTTLIRRIVSRSDKTCIRFNSTESNNENGSDIECVVATDDVTLIEPNSFLKCLKSPVEDGDLAALAEFGRLKWLVLDNTKVSDAGLVFLYGLTELRRLYVRGSQVTPEGVRRLQLALPDLKVVLH